ncbi:unnamed protein product [Dovyalis caffra]|uniref:Uncharacterized protein n=1 Tax=Dovyalis caffra TaxID=77055 RepID=A0AAV1R0E3_9ROSI|nr:unnamed protein product [Dovyalis caffra]
MYILCEKLHIVLLLACIIHRALEAVALVTRRQVRGSLSGACKFHQKFVFSDGDFYTIIEPPRKTYLEEAQRTLGNALRVSVKWKHFFISYGMHEANAVVGPTLVQSRDQETSTWQAPPHKWFKLYMDAALSSSCGLGVVIRNQFREVMLSACKGIQPQRSIAMGEAQAATYGQKRQDLSEDHSISSVSWVYCSPTQVTPTMVLVTN